MERYPKRSSRLVKSKNDLKSAKNYKIKKEKCYKKTEKQDFFTDLKKTRRNHVKKSVEKITTHKLTVRSKTLNYAVRSVFAAKENVSTLEEDSQAVIKEDLFKLIDLRNPDDRKIHPENLQIDQLSFPSKINPINEIPENKSVFLEIEEKFKQLGPFVENTEPYLISDTNLKALIQKKLDNQNKLILNYWESTFQKFFSYRNVSNIFVKIIKNQSKINESASLYEIKIKFNKTPLAETFVKRKFRKRCNNLINLQNLNGKIIMADESKILIDKHNVITTPKKRFPEISYTTPENQKISVKDFDFTAPKFTPAIRLNDKKYIELNKDVLLDPKFGSNFNIPEAQKNYLLTETLRAEKMETLNINNIFDRPKKPKTIQKKRLSFETPLNRPKMFSPQRRLDFSDILDDENFDLCLLDQKKRPLTFGQSRMTPKRGLESMLSPTELELRKKADQTKNKKFAGASMPKKIGTPVFKYGPNFFN